MRRVRRGEAYQTRDRIIEDAKKDAENIRASQELGWRVAIDPSPEVDRAGRRPVTFTLTDAAGTAVDRLAVYEVPYCMAEPVLRRSRAFLEQLGPMLAEGRRLY